jgi:hypothetical protein
MNLIIDLFPESLCSTLNSRIWEHVWNKSYSKMINSSFPSCVVSFNELSKNQLVSWRVKLKMVSFILPCPKMAWWKVRHSGERVKLVICGFEMGLCGFILENTWLRAQLVSVLVVNQQNHAAKAISISCSGFCSFFQFWDCFASLSSS